MPVYDYEYEENEGVSEEEVSALEEEYKEVVKGNLPEIQRLVRQAKALLDEAVRLSEQHGIPFCGPQSEDYIPHGLITSKFNNLSWDAIDDITGESVMRGYDSDDYGWMNSSSGC